MSEFTLTTFVRASKTNCQYWTNQIDSPLWKKALEQQYTPLRCGILPNERYKDVDITPHDSDYIAYYIAPHTKAIFSTQEMADKEFAISVKNRTCKYVDDDFNDERIVELIEN